MNIHCGQAKVTSQGWINKRRNELLSLWSIKHGMMS